MPGLRRVAVELGRFAVFLASVMLAGLAVDFFAQAYGALLSGRALGLSIVAVVPDNEPNATRMGWVMLAIGLALAALAAWGVSPTLGPAFGRRRK